MMERTGKKKKERKERRDKEMEKAPWWVLDISHTKRDGFIFISLQNLRAKGW